MIDDNPTNLELMVYLLRACGHEVVEAREGAEGIEKAKGESPALILLDIHMPQMDGYEVARRLRADPQCSDVPMVAVTALAMAGDRERILAAGFNGYIAKPIEASLFPSEVNQFIATRRRALATAHAEPEHEICASAPPQKKLALVLFVDNMQTNIDVVRSILEPSGFEVATALSAHEGLELARRVKPDLILSDVHMPHVDGYSFMRMVRNDAILRDIPFVLLSASVWSTREKAKALEQGASEFLSRPIEAQQLLEAVQVCLGKRTDGNGQDPHRG